MISITKRRTVATALSLSLLSSCATILYPERRGNAGGAIDVVPLVVDILLFIPGLVPGVIAIAVDFSTGAIYLGGGRRSDRMKVGRQGRVAIREPAVTQPTHVELRVLDAKRRVLAADTATWRPAAESGSTANESVAISLADVSAQLPDGDEGVELELELLVDGESTARYPLHMR